MKKLKETERKEKNCIRRRFGAIAALRRDNHGSAIVIVIIAMAMIGILASAILWSAYLNYMIKLTDIKNKNSFYSAETVMEQIMAGIEHEASAAISVSYQDVMKNWNNDENESNRYDRFVDAYLDTLVENLKSGSLGTGYYDSDILKSFVDTELFSRVLLDPLDPSDTDAMAWNNSSCKMELVNNASLILYDIRVSYTDENDYVSIVNTDICIDVPKLVFYQNDSIDGLYEYALIGNTGIETSPGSGASMIDGSIYAGTDDVLKTGGLTVESTSSLTIKNGRQVISKGDISVKGPTSGLLVRDVPGFGNEVYAVGLNLGRSSTLSLDSNTYVANDLLIYDTGSRVTLTKEYYGYGASTATGIDSGETVDSSESSAIIINGTNATVDMSGVTRLLLAGRAYIGQNVTRSALPEVLGGTSSPPVLMGESIAVKGGQIAYLVPAECIGTVDGKTTIGQNPLNGEMAASIDDYKEKYGTAFKEVDFDKPVYKLDNKTLREFGVTDMKNIRKVYAQYNSADSENKTLLYYYLVMDKDKAAEYFVQYYNFNTNKEALDGYFNKYAKGGIILGDYASENTQYTIMGNSLVSSALTESGVTLLTGIQQPAPEEGDAEEENPDEGEENGEIGGYQEVSDNAQVVANAKAEDEVLSLSANIANEYAALTANLTKDASTIGAGQNVFNSIIRENLLRDYLHDNGGTVTFTTPDGLKAVLTNDNTYTVSDSKVRLVVAVDADSDETDGVTGGNVKITKNFTGLIIAQGTITIDSNVSITRDKMDIYKVLNAPLSDTNAQTAMDFFVKGSGTLAEEVTGSSPVDATGSLDIDLSKIVRYMNWIKK